MYSLRSIFITILVGQLLSGCSFFIPTPGQSPKSDKLQVKFTHPDWRKNSDTNSDVDFAFTNNKNNSIIYVASLCRKYQDVSLKKLAEKLLSQFSSTEINLQEIFTYQSREALKTLAKGKLDGVPVAVTLVNIKKNECLYDMVLITPKGSALKKDRLDFEEFLTGVNLP
jgi:hypothetical protein